MNRTTLQVFVTYLIGAVYVHPLWFYKFEHDNRFRSKLFVACQRWWFEWRFWFVPSVPGYLCEEEEHKPDPWRSRIERNKKIHILLSQVYCVWQVVKTPTFISNNSVYCVSGLYFVTLVNLKLHVFRVGCLLREYVAVGGGPCIVLRGIGYHFLILLAYGYWIACMWRHNVGHICTCVLTNYLQAAESFLRS